MKYIEKKEPLFKVPSSSIYGRSSIGRVVVSKTIGCRFESYRPCKTRNNVTNNELH